MATWKKSPAYEEQITLINELLEVLSKHNADGGVIADNLISFDVTAKNSPSFDIGAVKIELVITFHAVKVE